ncbi:MAG: hypothetical protein R3F59_05825 [Myxococcota bacterium]
MEALGRTSWLMTPGLCVRRRAEIRDRASATWRGRALLADAGTFPSLLGRAEHGMSLLMLLVAEER